MIKEDTYTDIPEHGWAIYRWCCQHGSLWWESDACHSILVACQRRVWHVHIPFPSTPLPYSDSFISATKTLCTKSPFFFSLKASGVNCKYGCLVQWLTVRSSCKDRYINESLTLHKAHEQLKLSCMHKLSPCHEDVCSSQHTDPHIFNFSTTWT
jgi:hypothetical protein